MATLLDYCSMVRSKNAGPFTLTFDLMCRDELAFTALAESGALTADLISEIYSCHLDDVSIVFHPRALALKISIPRPVVQGDLADRDCYAGQQYPPLLELQLPELTQSSPGVPRTNPVSG